MTAHRFAPLSAGLVLFAIASIAPAASAQIAVSGNDNKVVNVNGVVKVVPNAPPDTVSVIDLKASPPRVIAEIQAPVSVAGPPLSVAVTLDESLAIVTASNKINPSDPTKQTRNNQVTVIDLKASPPKIIAGLTAGKGWVFAWDGSTLKDTGHRIKVNGGPAAIRTAEK
jgi:DNA-binding beta-propeller fold protein YncE